MGKKTSAFLAACMTFSVLSLSSCGASSESSQGTSKPTLKWAFEGTGGNFIGTAAIDSDGAIYFGTREGTVIALHSGGTLKWKTTVVITDYLDEFLPDGRPKDLEEAIPVGFNLALIPDSIWVQTHGEKEAEFFERQAPSLSSDESVLYLGGGISGKLFALNTSDGSINWQYDVRNLPELQNDKKHLGGGFNHAPTIGTDGSIYIGSGDHWGDQWYEALQIGIDVSKVKNRKYSDKRLYALNPDGSLKWIFTLEETDTHRTSIWRKPAIHKGKVYFASFNGILYCVDAASGTELWRHEVQGGELTQFQEFWSGPAMGSEGMLYYGNNDTNMYSFLPGGNVNWAYSTQNEVYQVPVVAEDGSVYCGSEDGYFYCIDSSGNLRWRVRLDAEPQDAALNCDNEVLVMSHNGTLYCFDNLQGNEQWALQTNSGEERMGFALASDGTIYTGADNEMIAWNYSSPLSTTAPWPKRARDLANRANADANSQLGGEHS